jgi:hypothetical protein
MDECRRNEYRGENLDNQDIYRMKIEDRECEQP